MLIGVVSLQENRKNQAMEASINYCYNHEIYEHIQENFPVVDSSIFFLLPSGCRFLIINFSEKKIISDVKF